MSFAFRGSVRLAGHHDGDTLAARRMNAQPLNEWEALDAAIAQAAKDCIDLMDKVTLATAAYRARNAELAQLIDSRSKEHARFLEERKGLR